MNSDPVATDSAHADEVATAPLPAATRRWRLAWMIGSILATIGLIAMLLRPAGPGRAEAAGQGSSPTPAAQTAKPEVVAPGLLRIPSGSPLLKRLEIVTLAPETTRQPTAVVSGVVVARIKDGTQPLEDRWQFGSSAISNLYSDFQRGRNEVNFASQQLAKTRELVTAETDFLSGTVERLSGLAQTANIPQKEFLAAKSALLKAQLQGEKDIYAAEADLRTARKNLAAVERSLAQAGAEPEMLGRAEEQMAIISADVPELKIGLVRPDQRCEMRFYGLPDRVYLGHVEQIGSTVTPERRTLRVFLHIEDAAAELRPGMFGEVSIGTDERQAIRVLETSVLHLDLQDFVLVAAGDDAWRAVPVRIGEGRNGRCDVLEGLKAGDHVIGRGAILLKSLLTQSFLENVEQGRDRQDAGKPSATGSAP
jgi:hypothetical protein